MTYDLTLNDDRYRMVADLAAARGQTPEEVLASLVDEAWERECASYDAAFENDPDWIAGAQEAVDEVRAGKTSSFSSTEAFLQSLDEGDSGPRDADV